MSVPSQTFPKTLIMIPAFNEADSIALVIGKIRAHAPWADIAVINDGSTDQTAAIAQANGAITLKLPYNVGIGAAVQTGFLYADQFGYEVAVQNDGDGQHPAEEIPLLVRSLIDQKTDVMIGSRYIEDRGYVTPLPRRVGQAFLSGLIRIITRKKMTDPTSGFRASNRQVIEYCARNYPYDYPEPEAIVMLHRAGFTLGEIPVTMNARYGGISSINAWNSGYYMIKVTLAILVGLLRSTKKA